MDPEEHHQGLHAVDYTPISLDSNRDSLTIIKAHIQVDQHPDQLEHVQCDYHNSHSHCCQICLFKPISKDRKLDKESNSRGTGRSVVLERDVRVFEEKREGLDMRSDKAEESQPRREKRFVKADQGKFDILGSMRFGEIEPV